MVDTIRQTDEGGAVPRPGILVANRYLVERTLGVGGMGAVVAARDVTLNRIVAVKFLLPQSDGDEQLVVRFDREARATERLRSEHVRRALDTGVDARGRRFLVMEYLEGEDLRALVKREGPLAPTRAAGYVAEACHGLAEAHALGVVHRDLKPANLFLAKRLDGSQIVKVVDFGVAKLMSPNIAGDARDMTSSQMVLGSRHYMAPEQILNPRDVDALADVWALGAILYYLLTGKTPFAAPSLEEMTLRMLSEPPHPISEIRPGLPTYLVDIVSRCLTRDRQKRFPNVVELLRALDPEVAEDDVGRASLFRTLNLGDFRVPPPPLPPPPPPPPARVAPTAHPPSPPARRGPDVSAVLGGAVVGAAIAMATHALLPARAVEPPRISSIASTLPRVSAPAALLVSADPVEVPLPPASADSPPPAPVASISTRVVPSRAQISAARAPSAAPPPAPPLPSSPPVAASAPPAKHRVFDVED